jgi:uncharacterized protein YfcZ (UPF0381/DUF406 family)
MQRSSVLAVLGHNQHGCSVTLQCQMPVKEETVEFGRVFNPRIELLKLFLSFRNNANQYTADEGRLSSQVEELEEFNAKLPFEYKYFDVLTTSKL